MTRWIFIAFSALCLTACGPEDKPSEPLAMPAKEKTWVKTEEVEQTRAAYLAKGDESTPQISIDESFQKTLLTPDSPPKGIIKDAASCKKVVKPLNDKRMALQRSGGLWHAFERSDLVRPHSNNGMQLDSNFNKVMQGLEHLCATAEGVPMSPLSRLVANLIKEKGKEGARTHLVGMGRAPKDIDIWFKHTEDSQRAAGRKVPYGDIEALVRQTKPILQAYEDLYNRKVDEANKNAFVSQAVTLLGVINKSLEKNQILSMALAEDFSEPQFMYEGQM